MKTQAPGTTNRCESIPADKEMAELFDPFHIPTWDLISRSHMIREQRFGNRVDLCGIINAKSGICSEDCSFCSQSTYHHSQAPVYPLVQEEHTLEEARKAESWGVRCFSLVTSGRGLAGKEEKRRLLRIVEMIRNHTRLEVGASLGLAEPDFLQELKKAGLNTYHHNLETAPSHYDRVCTTHPVEDRIRTIQFAKEAGLTVCSGGIFGLGENILQRAELAHLWKKLEVDRIPVNFLNPIPGTTLEQQPKIPPTEALHIIAALRQALPDQEIIICGGRDAVLRSLQPFLFMAGASGMMTGDYLTTKGQGVDKDHSMLKDLQLEWR